MTYIVAFKMMDIVIVGSRRAQIGADHLFQTKELGEVIMKELGLGLTIMHGKGGFSGEVREILFIIVERLILPNSKRSFCEKIRHAFMAIENLHEVVYGKHCAFVPTVKRHRTKLLKCLNDHEPAEHLSS